MMAPIDEQAQKVIDLLPEGADRKTLSNLVKNYRDLKKEKEKSDKKAAIDPMTGLLNRVVFEEHTKYLIEKYEQKLEEYRIRLGEEYEGGITCLFIDADHFKRINDTYGHPVGDELLITLSSSIEGSLRDYDRLFLTRWDHGDFNADTGIVQIARVGGDEFVSAIANTTLEQGEMIAKRVREDFIRNRGVWVRNYNIEHPEKIIKCDTTLSIGGTHFKKAASGFSDMIERSDHNLYEAKKTRNSVVMDKAS